MIRALILQFMFSTSQKVIASVRVCFDKGHFSARGQIEVTLLHIELFLSQGRVGKLLHEIIYADVAK